MKTVGELIEKLRQFPEDRKIGATRSLVFAPVLKVQGRELNEKHPGTVSRFDGENGSGDRVVELVFMSNSEAESCLEKPAET